MNNIIKGLVFGSVCCTGLYSIICILFYFFADSYVVPYWAGIFYAMFEAFVAVTLFDVSGHKDALVSLFLLWMSSMFPMVQTVGWFHLNRKFLLFTGFCYSIQVVGLMTHVVREQAREELKRVREQLRSLENPTYQPDSVVLDDLPSTNDSFAPSINPHLLENKLLCGNGE